MTVMLLPPPWMARCVARTPRMVRSRMVSWQSSPQPVQRAALERRERSREWRLTLGEYLPDLFAPIKIDATHTVMIYIYRRQPPGLRCARRRIVRKQILRVPHHVEPRMSRKIPIPGLWKYWDTLPR